MTFNITDTRSLATADEFNLNRLNDTTHFILPLQLLSLAYSTRDLFVGNISRSKSHLNFEDVQSQVISAQFFKTATIPGQLTQYLWEDVIGGIEATAHNITAALLGLNLGIQDGQCLVDKIVNVYQYNSRNLLLPYGVSAPFPFKILTDGNPP